MISGMDVVETRTRQAQTGTKIRTGRLARLPQRAVSDPITFERRVLPVLVVAAFAGLLLIQLVLALR